MKTVDRTKVRFIKHEKGRVRIDTESDTVKTIVKQNFSVENKKARFGKKQPKKLSAVSPLYSFKTGLTMDVMRFLRNCEEWNGKIEVDDKVKEVIRPFSIGVSEDEIVRPENSGYEYRDYQLKAIRKGLFFGRGNIHSATSSGKSLIIYGLMKNIVRYLKTDFRFLLIVPNPQLVQQFFDDMHDYGSGDDPDVIPARFASFADDTGGNENVVIANQDWLLRHSDKLPWRENGVFVDEVHNLKKNNRITSFVNKRVTNTRFGFTGTLSDNNAPEELWEIKGVIGPEIFTKYPHELQDEGYIADVNIGLITFIHDKKQPKPSPEQMDEIKEKAKKNPQTTSENMEIAKKMYPLEVEYVESCTNVNNFMAKFIYNLKGNTIALFDHLEHINTMYDIVQKLNEFDNDREIYLITGKTPYKRREEIKAEFENIDNGILLAMSGCFKLGINIKNIRNLVFANGYSKACVKVIQSVGRGLRKSETKGEVNLFDFHHSFKYSARHFSERLKLYKEYFNKDKNDFKCRDVDAQQRRDSP